MPRRLPRITLVRRGVRVRRPDDVLSTARWWVVRVRNADSPSKCWVVYGGHADTVRGCLAEHAAYEPLTEVIAYPFADGHASMVFRHRIEAKYMAPRGKCAA